MPRTKTAKKQLQITRRNTAHNLHYRTALKTAVKKARVAIEEGTDADAAMTALDNAKKVLHRSATRNLIKRQNASRRVSRLSQAYNRAFVAPAESPAPAAAEQAEPESAE